MQMSLEGTALVIGGSSGMGQGAARALVARGVAVTVTSRTDAGVARAVAALDDVVAAPGVEQRGRVEGARCDLVDVDSVAAAVDSVGRLDHLVVSAAPARGGTNEDFFDGKFWGTKAAAFAAAERMPEHGTMTFVSGGMAVRPPRGTWAVATAFAAVEALARALAVEFAPRRVNCIRPGLFDTNTFSQMSTEERARFIADKTESLPLPRAGTGEDFGDALVGIIGARYLTGQVVVLDGGISLRAD
jgi:NAD(P)-dependent dehydrogenase (short-subunit alcohol dehydrogenase family)